MQSTRLKHLINSKYFESSIFAIILLNAIIIYLQVGGAESLLLSIIDYTCMLIFLLEMILKHIAFGVKAYWSDNWNRLDGTLVLLSLPALASPFVSFNLANLSVLLTFRLLRAIRFFRVMHFFPNFPTLLKGFSRAMRESWAVLASFAVIIICMGLINCSLFQDVAPEYFATPADSIYSIFRLLTIEGWYDIPDAVAKASSPLAGAWIRLYFCILLIGGGIIGMSFINSIFVDAMVEDNNDGVLAKLDELNKKIDNLQKQLNEKQ